MKWFTRLVCSATVLSATSAFAAGYDTPMLYSAYHMGSGGTAIGSVDDATAIFHNPAGLSLSGKGSAVVDFSPLMGQIQGSPDENARSIKSAFAMSPFFFLGGSYQLHDRIHIGAAAYLLGGAAGSYAYDYTKFGGTYHAVDSAKLSFIEVSPTVSVKILDNLRFGVTYRPVITSFDRTRFDTPASGGAQVTNLDLSMKGVGWTGVRLGLQYDVTPNLSMGLTFRNKVDITVAADKITYSAFEFDNATYHFILPAKLGYGLHWKINEILRVAADFEYIFNSQNDVVNLAGNQIIGPVSTPLVVPNAMYWKDSFTIRVGGAVKVSKPLELRAGYVFDSQAANIRYPTAFGSPPGNTQIGTLGAGYTFSPLFDMSLAVAARYGSATVSETDSPPADVHKASPFSGYPGDYAILLIGAYIDARFHFGIVDKTPIMEDEAPVAEPAADSPTAP